MQVAPTKSIRSLLQAIHHLVNTQRRKCQVDVTVIPGDMLPQELLHLICGNALVRNCYTLPTQPLGKRLVVECDQPQTVHYCGKLVGVLTVEFAPLKHRMVAKW